MNKGQSIKLTHTLSHSLSLSLTNTHSLSLSLSLSHTNTLSLSLSHTHTLSLFLSHTQTLSLSLTHKHSLSLSHTHTHNTLLSLLSSPFHLSSHKSHQNLSLKNSNDAILRKIKFRKNSGCRLSHHHRAILNFCLKVLSYLLPPTGKKYT